MHGPAAKRLAAPGRVTAQNSESRDVIMIHERHRRQYDQPARQKCGRMHGASTSANGEFVMSRTHPVTEMNGIVFCVEVSRCTQPHPAKKLCQVACSREQEDGQSPWQHAASALLTSPAQAPECPSPSLSFIAEMPVPRSSTQSHRGSQHICSPDSKKGAHNTALTQHLAKCGFPVVRPEAPFILLIRIDATHPQPNVIWRLHGAVEQ